MKPIENTLPRFEIKSVQSDFPSVRISNTSTAADFIRQFYGDDIFIFESSFILLLNNSNNTIGFAKISQGGITGTVVDARLVAHYAVNSLATSVILAHNHPSGNLNPSESDRQLTNKIKEGLKLLDISLLDHIILTGASYTSFADSGIL
jgi:DNA repair protein RadC